jgi:hypothetical protein
VDVDAKKLEIDKEKFAFKIKDILFSVNSSAGILLKTLESNDPEIIVYFIMAGIKELLRTLEAKGAAELVRGEE